MISYQDLNFYLDLNFTYICEIYACMLNLKNNFKIEKFFYAKNLDLKFNFRI